MFDSDDWEMSGKVKQHNRSIKCMKALRIWASRWTMSSVKTFGTIDDRAYKLCGWGERMSSSSRNFVPTTTGGPRSDAHAKWQSISIRQGPGDARVPENKAVVSQWGKVYQIRRDKRGLLGSGNYSWSLQRGFGRWRSAVCNLRLE